MWFAALIPLLSSIFGENGPIGQYFKTKAQQVQATADLAMQVEKDKMQLSGILAQAAVDSEKNKLGATSQGFKFVTFVMLSLPIIITCFAPEYGKRIFDNLSSIPTGWFQLWGTVIGVIWGLPIAANAMSTILSSFQDFTESRTQGKIAKIQALGEATGMNLEQAKAQIFDIMKQTVHLNGYTQGQVDAMNKVLDPLLNKVAGGQ